MRENRGMRKVCSKCKQIKLFTEFYKDSGIHSSKSGYKSHCKVCQKQQRRIYLQSVKGQEVTKRYSRTEKSKARHKRYCLRHPDRRIAKDAVSIAVASGRLIHPKNLSCYYCGQRAEHYHHHKGYESNYQLTVVPACRKCHVNVHRKVAI
jgi:hypothetical protein